MVRQAGIRELAGSLVNQGLSHGKALWRTRDNLAGTDGEERTYIRGAQVKVVGLLGELRVAGEWENQGRTMTDTYTLHTYIHTLHYMHTYVRTYIYIYVYIRCIHACIHAYIFP